MELPDQIAAGDMAGWLRREMKRRRMTQRMLGVRTGLDHSTVCRLLAGDREPKLSTVLAVVRVLSPSP